MKIGIESNLLRSLFKNVYFINGTAYAGKSTAVKNLAERFDGICCGENYHDALTDLVDPEHQPNLCYFQTMSGWQEFINRTPKEYAAWIDGTSREAAELEILALIHLTQACPDKPIFADTNIRPELLHEISDYNHVAIMLSPQSTSVDRFFDRSDPEKQFLLQKIQEAENPEKTMANFRACMVEINSFENYRAFEESGFFVLVRNDSRTPEETCELLARHFHLAQDNHTAQKKPCISSPKPFLPRANPTKRGQSMLQLIPYDDSLSDKLVPFVISFWKVHHSNVSSEQAREMLLDWTKENHRLFVIQKDTQVAGFLRTHNSSPTVCWIDDIYVDVPHRGQGVATGAIGMMESALRAEGVKSFCMEVVPDNLPAMRLYYRLGYDRLSLITMRKDDEPFRAARTETIAGIPLRVKEFDD